MLPCTLFNSRLQRKQLTNDANYPWSVPEFPLVPMWVLARSLCLLLWLQTKQVALKKKKKYLWLFSKTRPWLTTELCLFFPPQVHISRVFFLFSKLWTWNSKSVPKRVGNSQKQTHPTDKPATSCKQTVFKPVSCHNVPLHTLSYCKT